MYYKFLIKNFLNDIKDFFLYDLRRRGPELDMEEVKKIPNSIDLQISKDGKGFIIIAESLPGFVVHVPSQEDIAEYVKDALNVYYDVPSYYAKRISSKGSIVKDETGEVISIGKGKITDKIFDKNEKLRYVGS